MKEHKRVTIYLPEDEYRELRSRLILKGQTVSQWVREAIKRFLARER